MDIFHAHHPGSGGYDEVFSVHTGTEPGFFWLNTLAEDYGPCSRKLCLRRCGKVPNMRAPDSAGH
nr:hypothetical protein [Paenibacillus polymyxa]